MSIDIGQARDLMMRGAHVRVSSATGDGTVLAEGKAVAYHAAPCLMIRKDCGHTSSWPITLPIEEIPAPAPAAPEPEIRFGLTVDSENGAHVRFRVFAATGGQHLGGCGALVMSVTEFAAFRELLGPLLTDRPDPASRPEAGARAGR